MFSVFLFVLSIGGLCAACFRFSKTDAAFTPILTLSSCILILFLSAQIGCLAAASRGLLWLGVCFFFLFLCRDRQAFDYWKHPGFCFFLLLSLGIAIAGYGKTPDQYDNYTHWALITKEMYQTDALPVADSLVTFINYPPATGLWGYYCLKCLRYGEDIMIAAQGMLAAAALSAMFAETRWNNGRRILCTAFAAGMMCCVIADNLLNLYVDAMLGYFSVAALFLIRFCIRKERFRPWCAAVVLSALILIKPSAMLLVLLCVLFAILCTLSCTPAKRRTRWLLTVIGTTGGIPALFYGLFWMYTQARFGKDYHVPFDVSINGAQNGLASKSASFFSSFSSSFLSALVDFSYRPIAVFWIFAAFFCLFLLLYKAHGGTRISGTFLWFLPASLLLYVGGLFVMYVCWMSESESLILASFARYMGTGVLFFIGGAFLALSSRSLSALRRPNLLCFLFCLLMLICSGIGIFPTGESADAVQIRMNARTEAISAAQYLTAEIPDLSGSTTPLYCVDDRIDAGYYYYIVRYAFMRRYVWAMQSESIEKDVWGKDSEDCLILLLHWNEATETYLQQNFKNEDFIAGLYQKSGDTLTLLYTASEILS